MKMKQAVPGNSITERSLRKNNWRLSNGNCLGENMVYNNICRTIWWYKNIKLGLCPRDNQVIQYALVSLFHLGKSITSSYVTFPGSLAYAPAVAEKQTFQMFVSVANRSLENAVVWGVTGGTLLTCHFFLILYIFYQSRKNSHNFKARKQNM